MDDDSRSIDEYQKLMDGAADEITLIHSGNMEYIAWLKSSAPWLHRWLTVHLGIEIDRSVGIMPLPVFATLLGLLVAGHRHAYAMWQNRDLLKMLSQDVPRWAM